MKRFVCHLQLSLILILTGISMMTTAANAEPAPKLKTLYCADGLIWRAKPGETKKLSIIAQFTDGSSRDVTTECKWWVLDNSKGGPKLTSGDGMYKARGPAPQEYSIVAFFDADLDQRYDGPGDGQVDIRVEVPAPELKSLHANSRIWQAKAGDILQFIITATFDDGTTRDVTTECKWLAIDNPKVGDAHKIIISSDGVFKARGPAPKSYEIVAFFDGDLDQKYNGPGDAQVDISVRVTAPKLKKLHSEHGGVWNATPGETKKLSIIAQFTDGSSRDVTTECKWWVIDNPQAGDVRKLISGEGVFKARGPAPKSYEIVAFFDGDLDQNYNGPNDAQLDTIVHVTAPADTIHKPVSLKVEPAVWNDGKPGEKKKFIVTATFSDGTKKIVTGDCAWHGDASTPGVIEVPGSSKGRALGEVKALLPGKTSVSIRYNLNPSSSGKDLKLKIPVTITAPIAGGASVGMKVNPANGPYAIGDKIKFTQDVQKMNPKNTYTYLWHVDGTMVKKGRDYTHTFTEPGLHYVQLEIKSSDPKENDAITKNISVEYPPDMEVHIRFNPETNLYKVGSTVGFVAEVENPSGKTEYRWYVSGEYIGSGKTDVSHKFEENGEFEIKLGLRKGSNFDEVKVTRTLIVGNAGIGTLGRLRNRFVAKGAPDNLEIQSEEYLFGFSDWSGPTRFNGGQTGPVDHYIHYDGDQDGGWNTGFLVYVPKGKNELHYKVFHFRWPANSMDPSASGFVNDSGWLDLHNKTIVPDSVTFTRKASRLCEVEWRTEDGSSCRARIWKNLASSTVGTITQSSFTDGGVKDLGCEAGVYPPIEDKVDIPVPDDTDKDDDITDDGGSGDGETNDLDDSNDLDSNDDNDGVTGAGDAGGASGSEDDNDDDIENTEDGTLGGGGPGSGITDLEGVPDGGSSGILLPDGSTGSGIAGGGGSGGGLAAGTGGAGTGTAGGSATATSLLSGLWVSENGHQIRISQSEKTLTATALENKGSVGWKTAGGSVNLGTVSMLSGSIGKISNDGTRIEWGPGLFWTRTSTSQSGEIAITPGQVSGLYTQNGHTFHITQDGEKLTATALENKGPEGWKKIYGSVKKDGRVSFQFDVMLFAKLSPDGKEIRWDNGAVWSCFNSSPTAQDIYDHSFHPFNLTGLFTQDGHHFQITQDGEKISVVALENKGPAGWKTASGNISYWTVNLSFDGWLLSGTLSPDGKEIRWNNGVVWSRQNSSSQAPSQKIKPVITGYGKK